MINILKKRISALLIISIILSTCVSCKSIKIANSKDSSIKDYSYGKAMILVACEKNKYEKRFGKEIWDLKNGDGTQNFSDLIVQNVRTFIEKIMTINKMSERYNISINDSDEKKLQDASNEFYDGLTEGDMNYIVCTKDDVLSMYEDFHKARLTIDHITKNADVELSISEAKVIRVQYVELENYADALSVSTKSQARGANFAYFAKQYTTTNDNIERIVMRGDDFSKPFPEIFYMATGEVSEPLEHAGKFYVFKCLNDYMEEETSKRKEDILKQLKEDAFNEEFLLYEKENKVVTSSAFWKKIDLISGENCTCDNFYDIYYKYFPIKNE